MSYRIRIEHLSRYSYANPVDSSFNEVRVTPLTTPRQVVLDSEVHVRPRTDLHTYIDYWGTVVHAFDLHEPHDELVIVGRSTVETMPPDEPSEGLIWAELDSTDFRDRYAEFLSPSEQVPNDDRLLDEARYLRHQNNPSGAARAAIAWVRDQLRYKPGTTGVNTSAIEAWSLGEGVCQDFAHLSLAVIRAMGLPARYCSGYMHPKLDVEIGETDRGESHAWIEVWTGDWLSLDPTAGDATDSRYVLVARGRDYADVAPVKGIFHGGPTSNLDVEVTLTRTA